MNVRDRRFAVVTVDVVLRKKMFLPKNTVSCRKHAADVFCF